MTIILILLFITITILSYVLKGGQGIIYSCIVTIPLLIMYFKSNDIIKLIKRRKEKSDKNNLSERKEVEFVSSRDRNNAVPKSKKKTNKEKKKLNIKMPKIKRKKKVEKTREDKTKKKSIWKKLLTIILGFLILCIFMAMAFLIYIVISTGSFDPEALKNQDQTVILDKNGEVFATLGDQKRESVTYEELPQVLVDAIVATEDSRYYQHNGVDMARFMKASVLQVIGVSSAGGASTLTMQVVKNNLTDTESEGIKGIIRKFKDVYLSVFFMEKKYTKEEILEMYVNDSCLGGTIYGVEEASKYYFGKSVSELSLPEASLIAGMYQAPNRYNPYKFPENAEKRRATVLSLMKRHGYITKEEEKMAKDVSIESMLTEEKTIGDYQGYIDTVIEEVERKTGDNPIKVSMKIYTALDKDVQDGINKVLNGESHKWENDSLQAGIAVTNVNDGTIIAIGAGRNRKAGDWNYATQSYRQPGSTAKPIFDYGPGFEFNDFSTYTLFNDEPWNYTNGPQVGNWDGGYEGLITLRRAISVSRNIPALKAFQQVDKKNIANFVNGLGLDIAYSTKSENYKKYDNGADNLLNEAYSIGGMSRGVTPLDMAEAYACFANGGYHIETHAVTKIEYRDTGKTVEFTEEKEKVMSESTAYLMNNILQYAVEAGFNGGARVYGSTVAAKTGTSNLSADVAKQLGVPSYAVNDLWTVAYTPELAISLWYGYEKTDKDHFLSGASAPKDAVMRSVMQYIPKSTKKWEVPSSVVQVTVEKDSWPAKLPSEYTPDSMKVTEYFKKGTQPTEVSDRYAKLPSVTNLQKEKKGNSYKLSWTWKAPDALDKEALTKYFNNPVFGKQSSNYLDSRLSYNENTLGGNGFGIYVKEGSTLKQVGFTKETEYTYHPDKIGNIEIVVKAEYKSFKANASDGATIEIKSTSTGTDTTTTSDLNVELEGANKLTVAKGSYSDPGIKVIFDGKDVTDKALIIYSVDNAPLTEKALNSKINSLNSGEEVTITYKVTYNIIYKKEITRTVKIS